MQLIELQEEVRFLKLKADDEKGHSRRNNLCIIGLPEQVQGHSMELFLEKWLTDMVLDGKQLTFVSVE